jgi:hypothetical protein
LISQIAGSTLRIYRKISANKGYRIARRRAIPLSGATWNAEGWRLVGRFKERQGFIEWNADNSIEAVGDDSLNQLLGSSFSYRIAIGPQAGRKVYTLNPYPLANRRNHVGDIADMVVRFFRRAGVVARAHEGRKLRWL